MKDTAIRVKTLHNKEWQYVNEAVIMSKGEIESSEMNFNLFLHNKAKAKELMLIMLSRKEELSAIAEVTFNINYPPITEYKVEKYLEF